jgi:hypothetical protein
MGRQENYAVHWSDSLAYIHITVHYFSNACLHYALITPLYRDFGVLYPKLLISSFRA